MTTYRDRVAKIRRETRRESLVSMRADLERASRRAHAYARANPVIRTRDGESAADLAQALDHAIADVLAVRVDLDDILGDDFDEPLSVAAKAAMRFVDLDPERPLSWWWSSSACRAVLSAKGRLDGLQRAVPLATNRALRVTLNVLPVAHRPRYDEEFRAQLAELPSQARAAYAVRLASRSWPLRRALTRQPSDT